MNTQFSPGQVSHFCSNFKKDCLNILVYLLYLRSNLLLPSFQRSLERLMGACFYLLIVMCSIMLVPAYSYRTGYIASTLIFIDHRTSSIKMLPLVLLLAHSTLGAGKKTFTLTLCYGGTGTKVLRSLILGFSAFYCNGSCWLAMLIANRAE